MFLSTNHKDIVTLYLIFAVISGIAGTVLLLYIKVILASPNFNFLDYNYYLYIVIVTGHVLLMIFFMVLPILVNKKEKLQLNLLYIKALCFYVEKINGIILIIFIIKVLYAICNLCWSTFINLCENKGSILATSPSSLDSTSDGDSEKPPNTHETRDSMVEKAKAERDKNFDENSSYEIGIGSGTYEGTNMDGDACAAFAVKLEIVGYEVFADDNVSCGSNIQTVQDRFHEGYQQGLEERAPSRAVNQDINENYQESKKKK